MHHCRLVPSSLLLTEEPERADSVDMCVCVYIDVGASFPIKGDKCHINSVISSKLMVEWEFFIWLKYFILFSWAISQTRCETIRYSKRILCRSKQQSSKVKWMLRPQWATLVQCQKPRNYLVDNLMCDHRLHFPGLTTPTKLLSLVQLTTDNEVWVVLLPVWFLGVCKPNEDTILFGLF